MSTTITYACDHCGAACSGNVYASLWDEGDETKAYTHTRLDGCSREHLGFAVAKAFGIGLDGSMCAVIDKLQNALADAGKVAKARTTELESKNADLAHYKATLAARDLELAETKKALHESNERHALLLSLTGPQKPTKPAIDDCEAYIEARMDYRRVVGGTAADMEAFWQANRASFHRDERLVVANGDIVRDMEFEA